MLERRRFIGKCGGTALGGAALIGSPGAVFGAVAGADTGHGLSAATFKALLDQPFRCFTDRGHAERLALAEVRDGPRQPGLEQFSLVLCQNSGSKPLAAGLYSVYHRDTGRLLVHLAPSATGSGRYTTYFGLFS